MKGQIEDYVVILFSLVHRQISFLLFLFKNPDEQEVVVEVPRVQNPPKPVMTTRPTAVKATGTVLFFPPIFSPKSLIRIKLGFYKKYFIERFSVVKLHILP